MPKVRYTTNHQGQKAGAVADVTDARAQMLFKAGVAEEFKPPARQDAEGNEVMRVRFRDGITIAGNSYPAGATADLTVSEEAWAAVNEGHCDLVPPPGEVVGDGFQPFPPEWVTRSEETEVPLPAAQQQPPITAGPAATAALTTGARAEPPARPTEKAPAPTPRRTGTAGQPTSETVSTDPHAPPPKGRNQT